MSYLSSTQLARVQQFLPLYLEGQRRIGVPWALLAAIHYRESNLQDSAERAGGPMQFDPPLSGDLVRRFGAKYGISDLGDPETDARTAILCAAAFLQGKAAQLAKVLKPDSSITDIADVAFSYNGRGYGTWQRSPYVSNDPQNGVQMRITGSVPDSNNPSIRVRIDRPDTRPGVLAIIRELLVRVTLPTTTPVVIPATPVVVITPTTPPTPSGPVSSPPGPGLGRVLLADQAGKFGLAPAGDFVYRDMFYSRKPNGDLWIRPATPEEQK